MTQDRRRLKIVHLDTGKELRGGQVQLLMLARGLKARSHRQLIVCPEDSALEELARREGFDVFSLQPHDAAYAHGTLQLQQKLQAEGHEILHTHDGRSQTIAWLTSLGLPIRRVASRRVTFLPGGPFGHWLKYDMSCHGLIAVSEFVRQVLVSAGVPEEKVEVIPDGVELPSQFPGSDARARVRALWGFSEQEFVVGHIGAFTPEKGQEAALEATAILAPKLPEARMVLAGDGPVRSSARFQQKVQAAQGRVHLEGYVESLPEFLSALDLFIMPSRAEGLGSAALLAMAYGLPVVASRVGGLPEVVEEGKTGWLVAPESPQALAEAILVAASDRERLRRLGANARARARQFSNDIMVERTESYYFRVLAK